VGPRAFRLLWDAHSVGGIVLGLGLFVIFYAGALSLYRGELGSWSDPSQLAGDVELSLDEAVQPVLADHPPIPGTDVLVTWPFAGRPAYYAAFETSEADSTRTILALISSTTGEVLSETGRAGRSSVAEMVYSLHFFGQAGTPGRVVSGFVAVFLLVTIVTGVLVHLRRLPEDWHTFRPRAALRTIVADVHKVLGLLGLPFAAMYAISGAFLGLLTILLAPTVLVVFDGDLARVESLAAGYELPPHEATGRPAEMVSFSALERALPASWEGTVHPQAITVHGWGDEAAIATVTGEARRSLTATPAAVLDATSGELISANDPTVGGPLGGATAALRNLHYALVGPGTPLAKALYFILALATAAVILTGNVLWVLVRRPRDPRATPLLHRVLARLTVGVGCGLVAAIPAAFLATAALPVRPPLLHTIEAIVLFGSWGLLSAAAFAGPSPMWAARWQLMLGGILSLLVPIASGISGGYWPWVAAQAGLWSVVTVDLGFVLMAVLLLSAASRVRPAALHDSATVPRSPAVAT